MFRLSCRAVSFLNTGLKSLNAGEKCRRTLVQLIPRVTQSAFYSKDVRDVKSPLATLIRQQQQDQKQQGAPSDDGKRDKQARKERSWRHMKYTFIIFGISFACGGIYLIAELGRPKHDDKGDIVIDQFSSMSLIKQYFLRTLSELDYYGQLIKEPSREKLLPDIINHPMYHPKYTLVLEFTDVVVHPEWTYTTGWRFKKRPGLDNFLENLHGIYEIVIYTAEQGLTVFPIIEALDPRNLINYKLVRDATLFIDGKHVKDIDKLNRDLSKVIVVDWNEECTKAHAENVLRIPRWKGNDDDTDLITLTSFLLAISQTEIEDVRDVLKVYHEYDDPLAVYKERQKRLIERAEADAEEERDKLASKTTLNRWKPMFFNKRNI